MLHNRACTPPCRALRSEPSESNAHDEPSRLSFLNASPRVPTERCLGLCEENEYEGGVREECSGCENEERGARTERSPSWCVTYAMPRPSTCSFSIRRVSEDMTGLERSSTTANTTTSHVTTSVRMNAVSLPRISCHEKEDNEEEEEEGELAGRRRGVRAEGNAERTQLQGCCHKHNSSSNEDDSAGDVGCGGRAMRRGLGGTWPGARGSRVQLALWPIPQPQKEDNAGDGVAMCEPSASTPSHHHLHTQPPQEGEEEGEEGERGCVGNDMTQCFRTPEVCRYAFSYNPALTTTTTTNSNDGAHNVCGNGLVSPAAGTTVTSSHNNAAAAAVAGSAYALPVVPSLLYTPQVGSSTLALRSQLDEELDGVNALYRVHPLPAMTTVLENALYVGGFPDAETLPRLREAGVTHIVNCCAEDYITDPALRDEFAVHEFAARDQTDYLILHHHGDAFVQLVQALLRRHERVFVHCIAGVNRSIALCVYFLMECTGMTPLEAVRLLHRHGRMRLLENVGFRHQLIDHQLSAMCPAPPHYTPGTAAELQGLPAQLTTTTTTATAMTMSPPPLTPGG